MIRLAIVLSALSIGVTPGFAQSTSFKVPVGAAAGASAPTEPAQTTTPATTQQAQADKGSAPQVPVGTAQGQAVPAGSQAAANINPPSDQATAGSDQQDATAGAAASGVATAATAPDKGTPDGTAPGNSGSTGWTGGTGGSQIGTNTAGAVPESKTWQPPTARGLDLRG